MVVACIAVLGVLFASPTARAEFTLPDLPYAYDALEPHIDSRTMEIHHSKHHATYVANLNKAIKDSPLAAEDIKKMQVKLAEIKTPALRNNGGGHYNHANFWINMAPEGKGGTPAAELKQAINTAFGSMDEMTKKFSEAALTRFGSGWAWLGVKPDGSLGVTSTANQDNPLMAGLEYPCEKMEPILGLDVWEHAYYLKYQNRRPDYIKAFWNVVNWNQVNDNYKAAQKAIKNEL